MTTSYGMQKVYLAAYVMNSCMRVLENKQADWVIDSKMLRPIAKLRYLRNCLNEMVEKCYYNPTDKELLDKVIAIFSYDPAQETEVLVKSVSSGKRVCTSISWNPRENVFIGLGELAEYVATKYYSQHTWRNAKHPWLHLAIRRGNKYV